MHVFRLSLACSQPLGGDFKLEMPSYSWHKSDRMLNIFEFLWAMNLAGIVYKSLVVI
jgi:hypothetical protein